MTFTRINFVPLNVEASCEFFFHAPRWLVYVSELCTHALTISLDLIPIDRTHMTIYQSIGWDPFSSHARRQPWSSWDKYNKRKNRWNKTMQSCTTRHAPKQNACARVKFCYWFCVLTSCELVKCVSLLFAIWFVFRFHWTEHPPCSSNKLKIFVFFIEFLNNVIWIWMKSCRKCNWIYLIWRWLNRKRAKKSSKKIVWWWICFAFVYQHTNTGQIDYRYIRLMIVYIYIVLYIHMSAE